jgi:RND family efflux transporter MFP subunit
VEKGLITLAFCALLSLPVLAQSPSQHLDDVFLDGEGSVIRAQLVPLRKGVFSAGISAIAERIAVQEGDLVEEGSLLIAFDCDGIEAARKTAQAGVDSAKATLEVNRELLKLNSVGPLEVKLNEAELAVAMGELDQTRAKLKHCEVRAPFAGAITLRAVEEYQFVEEGQAMLELVSRDKLEVRMLLPSTDLAWLRPGSSFSMLVEELDQAMPGTVVRIGGAVDPVSLTVPVFGRLFEQHEALLPGMSGRVQFDAAEHE